MCQNIPMKLSVKVIIIDDNEKILLLRRAPACKNNAGLWELPGGKMDSGESFDLALLREVREETGLEIELIRAAGVTQVELPAQRIVHLIMIGKALAGHVQLSPEHDDVRWLFPSELSTLNIIPHFFEFLRLHFPHC